MTFDLPSGKPRRTAPSGSGRRTPRSRPGRGATRVSATSGSSCRRGFIADVDDRPDRRRRPADRRASVGGHTVYVVKDLADPIGWYALVEAIEPRCPDRRADPGRRRADRHPRLAGGHRVARPRLDGPRGQPARPRGSHRPALAGRRATSRSTEVAASEIEGYAGFFDSAHDRITISEDLDDLVIVHEASHAWFDGNLFQERWIGEGLADEYASRVLAADHRDDAARGPSTGRADRQGRLRTSTPGGRRTGSTPTRPPTSGSATTRRGRSCGRSSTT